MKQKARESPSGKRSRTQTAWLVFKGMKLAEKRKRAKLVELQRPVLLRGAFTYQLCREQARKVLKFGKAKGEPLEKSANERG